MPAFPDFSFEEPLRPIRDRIRHLEAQVALPPESEAELRNLRTELTKVTRDIYEHLDAWDVVRVARHPERPQTIDYVELLFDEFVELHGDRSFGDDRAILTGFAKLAGQKVMFIGHQKGRNVRERNEANYGMAHPEGYRKALQRMQMAEKFGLPVICLIDTPGAYPGIGAEERGQAYQIAFNLREMSRVATPIVCVVIGEGGSGGALGIGIGDRVGMMQHAYYSVISPEGCAGILWKDSKFADKAARALKFTSRDLMRFGVIDEVVTEPVGGAHRNHRQAALNLQAMLQRNIKELLELPKQQLLDERYAKFRRMGQYEERVAADLSTLLEAVDESTQNGSVANGVGKLS